MDQRIKGENNEKLYIQLTEIKKNIQNSVYTHYLLTQINSI